MKNNADLKKIYNEAYQKGKDNFFTFDTKDITDRIVNELDYSDLEILEIGCGTGETAFRLSQKNPSSVKAWDYSESAINTAKLEHSNNNLTYEVRSIEQIEDTYDCIILQEVIEHTDDPKSTIELLTKHIRQDGHLILTCPSFLNMRGYVWMTLQILFDVPMSLTDKHFISPFDMKKWAGDLNLSLTWFTFRHQQSFGEKMVYDNPLCILIC